MKTDQPVTSFARLRELESKCLPVESWHPENWDAFTLQWLRSKDGTDTLAMLCEFRQLLPTLLDSHAALLADKDHLEWLMRNVSGAEWRRLGIIYSNGCTRADIDTARAAITAAEKAQP